MHNHEHCTCEKKQTNHKSNGILIAFFLNLSFSIIEFIGGLLTNSNAIISDAVHDMCDALSIVFAIIFQKISRKGPDEIYTYGYGRYSIIGAFITSIILFLSSVSIILNSAYKLFNPVDIEYNGVIMLAVLGFAINLIACLKTRHGHTLNEKAVSLHMLEDTLGWLIVLVGGFVMKLTNFVFIDPLLSIFISLYILKNATGNLKEIFEVLLLKTPNDINISEIKSFIDKLESVESVNYLHIWQLDDNNICACLSVQNRDGILPKEDKNLIKKFLQENGINYFTIEVEDGETNCCIQQHDTHFAHHHHHHHH